MGAWIEIIRPPYPSKAFVVAPHVGAWIEIEKKNKYSDNVAVAPHVGAWIEILRLAEIIPLDASHPTWVRGLKYSFVKLI